MPVPSHPLTTPGGGPAGHRALGAIRTRTIGVLNAVPLPVGIRGRKRSSRRVPYRGISRWRWQELNLHSRSGSFTGSWAHHIPGHRRDHGTGPAVVPVVHCGVDKELLGSQETGQCEEEHARGGTARPRVATLTTFSDGERDDGPKREPPCAACLLWGGSRSRHPVANREASPSTEAAVGRPDTRENGQYGRCDGETPCHRMRVAFWSSSCSATS